MGYVELNSNQQALLTVRKIQFITSSYSMNLVKGNLFGGLQLILIVFSLCSFTFFKYYTMERYHLYGCQRDYKTGFPQPCPIHLRPYGLDDDSVIALLAGIFGMLGTFAFPAILAAFSWKKELTEHISQNVHEYFKQRGLLEYERMFLKLLLESEGLKENDSLQKAKEHEHECFLRHLNSCVWVEVYLSHHFHEYKCLCFILAGLTASIFMPCLIFIWDDHWHGIVLFICSLLFNFFPIFVSISVMACLIVIKSNAYFVPLSIVLFCSVTFWIAFLIWMYKREASREAALVKRVYQEALAGERGITEKDTHILMDMRGYISDKSNINDEDIKKLLRRIFGRNV